MKRKSMVELCPDSKRVKLVEAERNPFDVLSDELIIIIFEKISASAESPSKLLVLNLICKRFEALAMDKTVLEKLQNESIWIDHEKWHDFSYWFLTRCADAGNIEACYFLGMIEFYCLNRHENGARLIAQAASALHVEALFSLAVIQFNGSGSETGGPLCQQDMTSAVGHCIRSSYLNHSDSLHEISYCLNNGLGLKACAHNADVLNTEANKILELRGGKVVHHAHLFLIDWWILKEMKNDENGGDDEEGLEVEEERLKCENVICGRTETRSCEFERMRCMVCKTNSYCSYACLETHRMTGHSVFCTGINRKL